MGNCSHTAPEVATATEAGKEEAKGVAMVEVATVAEAKAVVTAAAARADSAVLMEGTVEVGAGPSRTRRDPPSPLPYLVAVAFRVDTKERKRYFSLKSDRSCAICRFHKGWS